MASYILAIAAPGKSIKSVELKQARAIIGREAADVVIEDPRCSSRHAELVFDGRSLRVRDLGSTNGTWHEGKRITELIWTRGTSLTIGKYTLTLREIGMATGPGHTAIAGQTHYTAPNEESTIALPRTPLAKLRASVAGAGWSTWAGLAATLLLVAAGVVLKYGAQPRRDESQQSAVLASEMQELSINVATVTDGSTGPRVGVIEQARVRVAPNRSGHVSVGVTEEFLQGAGEQWRAATWLAAFNATRAHQESLANRDINVYVRGNIDGPSAGMLMTVAMLALMSHDSLRDSVTTMTGTINPDGTTGPVACIIEKMYAAKQAGMRRFGYPLGSRQQHSCTDDKRTEDLQEVAANLGLEAAEIRGIADAYEFATGKRLMRPEPLDDDELAVPKKTQDLLHAKIDDWQTRLKRAVPGVKHKELREMAEAAYARAVQDQQNDYLVSALQGYAQTFVILDLDNRSSALLERKSMASFSHDLENVQNELEAFGRELELKAECQTRGGQLKAALAFYSYANAWAYLQTAAESLKLAQAGQASSSLFRAIGIYEATHGFMDYARRVQDLANDENSGTALGSEDLERLIASYRAAAQAAVGTFDAVIVAPRARAANRSLESAQAHWREQDVDYAVASHALELAKASHGSRPHPAKQLLRLAAASYAYLVGAKLLNTWYSLGAQAAPPGAITIPNRKALSEQLDRGREHALMLASRAKAKLFIPSAARLAYAQASARREGSDLDKTLALTKYWESALWSELAATGL